MYTRIRTFVLILLQLSFTCSLIANEAFLYNKLRDKNWLLSSANSIYNQGGSYLWLGTDKGVYRYDGYNLKRYMNYLDKTLALHQNSYKIVADSLGNIWNLSAVGLGLYDNKNDVFNYELGKDIISGPLFSSCCIDNAILFGGKSKLYSYDYQKKNIEVICDLTKYSSESELTHLCQISKDTVIFNAKEILYFFNHKTKELNQLKCSGRITCIHLDNENRIWISIFHRGLYCFNKQGKLLVHLHTKNSSLNSNEILCMENQDSLIWIGTDGGGINLLNAKEETIHPLIHEGGIPQARLIKSIKCLHYDNNHTMWAGTVRNGVIGIRKSSIFSYHEAFGENPSGLSNRTVLSVFQENKDDHHVWIGTDGEGINRMNMKTRRFKHYDATKDLKVVSITSYDKSHLLVSVYFKGLMLFNKNTGKIEPFKLAKQDIDTDFLTGRVCTNLYKESDNSILLLTDKIFRLNLKERKIEELSVEGYQGYKNLIPAGEFRDFMYFYDERTIYKLKKGDTFMGILTTGLPQILLNSASVDASGKIWLGTNEGLKAYSIFDEKFEEMPNNLFLNISTVLADKNNRVWITYGSTVYVYQQESGSFALLGESDGIILNDYIDQAKYLTAQGDVFMGGSQGMLVVDHTFKFDNKELPKVILTDVSIDGELMHHLKNDSKNIANIPEGTKSIELYVNAVEADILRPKVYKFKVQGANEYIYESQTPIFKMNSPRPGVSSIYVTCQSRNGEWTEYSHLFTYNLLLPWYQSLWFKMLCFAIIVGFIIYAIYTVYHRKEDEFRLIMKEREKEIYQEKVRFLIHITHELRTPLTLISVPLKRIIRQSDASSAHYSSFNKIYHQVDRMKNLLNMVLDLRKMEVGESSLNISSNEFNHWVDNIVTDFSDDEGDSGIRIKTELDPSINQVNFDKHKCEIILSNLLVNAIKHSSEGDTIRVKTEIFEENLVKLSVIDNGTGISESDLSRLFNSYYQGNNEKLGTGIGLSYSKLLIELQGGNIGAYNNPDKGATFYITLPLDLKSGQVKCESKAYLNEVFPTTSDDKWLEVEQEYEATEIDTTDKILLIVDDNDELAEFIKEEYEKKFRTIYTASDGAEAFSKLAEYQPDIIVSDIMMPHMNGYELCQKVKNDVTFSHIPVILLTARTEALSKKLGYKLGADAFIQKPFEPDLLYSLIASQLKSRNDVKQKYIRLSGMPEPENETFSLADENFLMKLNDIIINNIDNSALDIPFICRELGMSRGSLYNKLKAITGISCNEYLNKVRLEHAKKLVMTTDLSFTEIADKTGFSNSSYFSTSFKQYVGKSPTQFRDECRKNEATGEVKEQKEKKEPEEGKETKELNKPKEEGKDE